LAKQFKLPVAEQPDSQEICFVQTTVKDFLSKHLKPRPGPIKDQGGRVLGQHRGLVFYTVGQRKGIDLPAGPYFVLDKNLKKNVLIVTKNEKDLYEKELLFKKANWISGKPLKLPFKAGAKIRYGHKAFSGVILKNKFVFNRPQRAITSGQSVVFYRGEEVLGGAIIS